MVSAPGLATQASATLAKTHTWPMKPRLIATRMGIPMECLLHPDLHRFLGSLGSLSLVWPLPSLRSYDRLVPSIVASDCVKRVHCWLPAVTRFVTYRHLLEFGVLVSKFLSHSRLRHDCSHDLFSYGFDALQRSGLMLATEFRSCAGSQTKLPYLRDWLQFSLPISHVTLLPCTIQFISY